MLFLVCASLLLATASAADRRTLRNLDGIQSNPPEFKQLSEQVLHEYAEQDAPQADPLPALPYERKPRISHLNRRYQSILFEGDIRVSRGQLRRLLRNSRAPRQAIRLRSAFWPRGRIPYSFHAGINDYKRRAIMETINFWERETCVRFLPRKAEKVYLHFVGHDSGCWSTVGRDADQGEQWVSIGNGCEPFGIASHEVAHAMGLFHEQSRNDRDDHVSLITQRIPPGLLYNFAKATTLDINNYGLPYDIGSVMHYSPEEFTTIRGQPSLVAKDVNKQQTMGALDGPSFIDVQILNEHYKCSRKCSSKRPCQNGGYTDPRNCAKCKCPPGYTGTLCDLEDYGNEPRCGGALTAGTTSQTLTIRLAPGNGQRQCIYHIKAPSGGRVTITIAEVRGRCEHGCGRERAEFKVDADPRPVGYRFCCPESRARRFTSSSSTVPVLVSGHEREAFVHFAYVAA